MTNVTRGDLRWLGDAQRGRDVFLVWYGVLLAVGIGLYLLARRWSAGRRASSEPDELLAIDPRGSRLNFLEWLRSDDADLRAKGSYTAMITRLTLNDLPRIYEAIRQAYTSDELTADVADAHRSLFMSLQRTHDPSTIDFIREIFPTLPPDPRIREYALRVLSEMNTNRSLKALLDLLEEYNPDLGAWGHGIFLMLSRERLQPNQVAVLFPRLLGLLDNESLKVSIYQLAVKAEREGLFSGDVLESLRERLVQDCRAAIQQRATAERHSPECDSAADLMCVALDAFPSLGSDEEIVRVVKGILEMPGSIARLQLEVSDLRLKATLALARMGVRLPARLLDRFAADARTRVELWDGLESAGGADLFPPAYRSQEHLAEGAMVNWLCSPSEMLGPPEQIELMDTRVAKVGGQQGRYYIYKFYYDHNPKLPHMPEGWLVGVTGPWPVKQERLDRTGDNHTFSTFPALDDADVDGHFAAYLEAIDDAHVPKMVRSPYRDDV